MSRVVTIHRVDGAGLEELLRPRDDVVRESPAGAGRFIADDGPFSRYERTVDAHADGTVTETIDFALAIPFWAPLFVPPYKRALRSRRARPWWAPPDRLDARASTVLGLLCAVAVVAGYLGTVITQTITFARDEFDVSRTAQTATLAAVRTGALIALAVAALADRRGRRRLLLVAAALGCLVTATGAFVPHLAWLGVSQTVARGFAGGTTLLLAIVSAEEMPAGTRAYAYSLITMASALGAGVCLWALPLADVDERGWRLLYLIPLLGLFVVRAVARRLPETRRFEVPHSDVPMAGHGRRFLLLAVSFFLLALFAAPASQIQNDFLRTERGFSAPRISLYTIVTATPGALGIIIGGRIADVRGRRGVAAVGIVGGSLATVATFLAHGWPLWAWSIAAAILGAMTIPVINVYRPELFPTSLRGRAAGTVEVIALTGSAIGLLVTGLLADRWGSYAGPIALLAIPALVVAVLFLVAFPETARRSLEDLNPEDEALPP